MKNIRRTGRGKGITQNNIILSNRALGGAIQEGTS